MPTDSALPRRAGEQTLPRRTPSVQTTPSESLGAVSIVCRSVFACLLAVALGLAVVLAVLLLL